MHPKNLFYSQEHIWVKDEGDGLYRLGLTQHYLTEIKNVVFLELPPVGAELKKGESFGALESSKISTDLTSPLSGAVVATNQAVLDKPGLVNRDPYGEGWLITLQPADPTEIQFLLTADKYLAATGSNTGGGPCQS